MRKAVLAMLKNGCYCCQCRTLEHGKGCKQNFMVLPVPKHFFPNTLAKVMLLDVAIKNGKGRTKTNVCQAMFGCFSWPA